MPKIFIGTTNPGKVAEIAALLTPCGVDLDTVSLEIEETENTFEGNARLKANAYAKHTGGIVLAEDSGLVVPVLGGLPGPYSARFAECIFSDEGGVTVIPSPRSREEIDYLNNLLVLEKMNGIQQPYRGAFFKIVLIVARENEVLFETTAESHGWISESPRGSEGFGYDPIFIGQDTFGKTYAEIDPVRKNLRSHRKRALNELFIWVSQHKDLIT